MISTASGLLEYVGWYCLGDVLSNKRILSSSAYLTQIATTSESPGLTPWLNSHYAVETG